MIVDNVAKLKGAIAHFMPELPANIAAPVCSLLLIFTQEWCSEAMDQVTPPGAGGRSF